MRNDEIHALFANDGDAVVTSDRVLYTPSTFARSSLLHVQEIGSLVARKVHSSARSGLRSWLFFMVREGSGTLTYGGVEYGLSVGSCVFIDCSSEYAHATDSGNLWSLSWCHFDGPALGSIYAKYRERGGRPAFVPESLDVFESVHQRLYETVTGRSHLRDMEANQLLAELLTLIMAESWHPEDAKQVHTKLNVQCVRNYIDGHYAERITLDSLSERFYINKFYLTRVFKEQYGTSVASYLQRVRITHAKRLLRFSDRTVAEVGAMTGLDTPQYFSRVFRDVEGCLRVCTGSNGEAGRASRFGLSPAE